MRVGTWDVMTVGASSVTAMSPSSVDTFSSTSPLSRDSIRMGSSCRGGGRGREGGVVKESRNVVVQE